MNTEPKEFLDFSFADIYNFLNIDYIIKIEGWENKHTETIEKIEITVINRETKDKNVFELDYEEALDANARLKQIIIHSIKEKYIKKDSIVGFIFDKKSFPDYLFGMIVIEVSKVLYRIARFKLTEYIENEQVLEKILEICEEIRTEGREGKTIGTLFVIGDENELQPYMKPLVLNPFYGYPDTLRDLLNNDLNETIKEYAQLDGAFIISNKGIVISAGTYIDIDTQNIKRYYGWGTKHMAAVALTTKTKSVGVLVSESGNTIKVFKDGKLILKY